MTESVYRQSADSHAADRQPNSRPSAPRPVVGRLAPTPSGRLHLGNVSAFAAAWLSARAQGGRLLLRIEDVDRVRADRAVEDSLRDDLAWLGLTWDEETRRQSERDYAPVLAALTSFTYYCDCTRAAIQAAGGVYPGTCRDRGRTEGAIRFRLPDETLPFVDRARGRHVTDLRSMGDPVLRRRDGLYAYNLAVVADDLADGVTEVVRGADLLDQSAVQICLWRALGHEPPTWLHSPLILGGDGRKLSKSHGSAHIGELKAAGWTVADVWDHVLPWLGIGVGKGDGKGAGGEAGRIERLERIERIEDAIPLFQPEAVPRGPITAPLFTSGSYILPDAAACPPTGDRTGDA
jgi:glutamyl/glutaminyl-tRNA synthetase